MHVNSGSWINCRAGPWGGKATVWIIAESLCQTPFVFLCNFELVHGIDISYPQAAEKATAPHSSIRAWKISWMEEPVRLQSMGSLRVRHDWVIYFHFSLSCIGEGNGNLGFSRQEHWSGFPLSSPGNCYSSSNTGLFPNFWKVSEMGTDTNTTVHANFHWV